MYRTVPNSCGSKRDFLVTVGLRYGYDATAKTFDKDVVAAAAEAWMVERAAAGKPYLTGVCKDGEVVYAYPKEGGGAVGCREPVVELSGVVSTLYNASLTDDEVRDLLNELADRLGLATGQTRVYVTYMDHTWVRQAEGTVTPRGDTV